MRIALHLGIALLWVALTQSTAGAQGEVWHVFRGGGVAGLGMGQVVNSAGDVNGDGLGDVIVGYRSGSGSWAGTAQVFSGADGSALFTFTGRASLDHLGHSVDGAGDVNGDGFDDVIVGAEGEDANGIDSGAAYIFSGQDGTQLYHFPGDYPGAHFGVAVSGVGDINGDGLDDVLVGGQPAPNTPQPRGHARVLSGADGSVLFDLVGSSSISRLGCAVDAAGDVNGDGVGDFVVGDWRDSTVVVGAGSVSVFSGVDGALLLQGFGDRAHDRLGSVVAGLGDVDGDGFDDVLAGTGVADGTLPDLGLVRVYAGIDGSVMHSIRGDATFDFFGAAAAGVGDFDADGLPDFAVGAFGDDDGGLQSGSVRVFSGLTGSELMRFDGDSPGDELGFSVSAAGDVQGDGGIDLAIGAPNDDQGGGRLSGAVFVLAGATPGEVARTYCLAGPNAVGPGAMIGYEGSLSASAQDLVLTVEGARPNRMGVFFYGSGQRQDPFMKGFLCVSPPFYRLGPPVHLDGLGAAQVAVQSVGSPWDTGLMVPGSTWDFQFLYLDPPARGTGPFNLSNGLEATFRP